MINKLNNWFYLSVLFVSFFSFSTTAQQWDSLGAAGFSPGNINGQSIASYNDTIYAAFGDGNNSNKLTVMKFDGTDWITVGTPNFSPGAALSISLAIDNNGVLYVAYLDNSNNNSIIVSKFDGTNWVSTGTLFQPGPYISKVILAIDNAGTPYVACDFSNGGPFPSITIAVYKYDGTNWQLIGGYVGNSHYTTKLEDFVLSTSGTLYLAYQDMNTNNLTYLYTSTFDGTNWVNYGTSTNGILQISYSRTASLAIDESSQVLYLATADDDNSNKATVMKCSGASSAWTLVGTAGFTSSSISFPSLVVQNSIPYLAFCDGANGGNVSAVSYNGSSWSALGTPGFSLGVVYHVNMIISNNKLYVGFKDEGKAKKSSVMQYNINLGVQEIKVLNNSISLFPNPTNDLLTVSSSEQINSISVLSIDGRFIKNSNNTTISVAELANGIYLIQVETSKGFAYQKFIKE